MKYAELSMSQKAMYDESSVERISTGVSIKLPLTSLLQNKYPHLTFADDDWKEVARCLKNFAFANLPAPTTLEVSTPTRGASPVPVSSKPTGEQEARIRELSGDRLVQVAVANAVVIVVHPTNPGITAMRRKNALLTLFRHGTSLANL